MSSEHTPGPITVVFEAPTGYRLLSPEGIAIAQVYGKANADLWAAAPELLEALSQLLAVAERAQIYVNVDCHLHETHNQANNDLINECLAARAIVTKAKGE